MAGNPKKTPTTEPIFNIAWRILMASAVAMAFTTLAADADVAEGHTNVFEQDLAKITLFAFGILQYLEAISGGLKLGKVFGNVTPTFDRLTSSLAIVGSGLAAAGCDLVRGGTSSLPPQLFKGVFGTLCGSDSLTAMKRGFFDKDIKGAAISGTRALVDLFLFFNVLYGIEGNNPLLMYLAIPACFLLATLDTYDITRNKPTKHIDPATQSLLSNPEDNEHRDETSSSSTSSNLHVGLEK